MYPPNQNIYSTTPTPYSYGYANEQDARMDRNRLYNTSPVGIVPTPRPGGFGSNGAPSPNYYNTFVNPMVPQPQLNGTGPSGGIRQGNNPPQNFNDPNRRGDFETWDDYQRRINSPMAQGTRNPDGSTSGTIPNQQGGNQNYPQQQGGGNQGSLSTMPTWYGEDPNSIRGSHADLSGINQQQAFAGLGAPDLKNHDQVFQLGENLRQQGHDVKPGLTDMYGRMDSLMIDGQLTRVFDSNGNWQLKSNANNDAWWYPDGSNQGNQGTMPGYPSQGQQGNDPNAWRRQHEMRQNQRPDYSVGNWNGWNQGGMQPQAMTTSATGGQVWGYGGQGSGMSVDGSNRPTNPTFGSTTVGLNGTSPSSIANMNGVPQNHPLANRLMY